MPERAVWWKFPLKQWLLNYGVPAATAPGNLFEMQILQLIPDPRNPETVRVGSTPDKARSPAASDGERCSRATSGCLRWPEAKSFFQRARAYGTLGGTQFLQGPVENADKGKVGLPEILPRNKVISWTNSKMLNSH